MWVIYLDKVLEINGTHKPGPQPRRKDMRTWKAMWEQLPPVRPHPWTLNPEDCSSIYFTALVNLEVCVLQDKRSVRSQISYLDKPLTELSSTETPARLRCERLSTSTSNWTTSSGTKAVFGNRTLRQMTSFSTRFCVPTGAGEVDVLRLLGPQMGGAGELRLLRKLADRAREKKYFLSSATGSWRWTLCSLRSRLGEIRTDFVAPTYISRKGFRMKTTNL